MKHIGLIGLGTMGANLARNAARNGATVAVYNRTTEKMTAFMSEHAREGEFIGCETIESLIEALPTPRAIILMVKAGSAVDAVIEELLPHLSEGDILIDAGNSLYTDTERRMQELATQKIRFIGMGVSGGEEGALHGPSMMPGGDESAINEVMPLLTKMAADDGMGGKCVAYMGSGGAGHFVKMVHNGIEYGIMQLIAESYDLLKRGCNKTNAELADIYDQWNKSPELSSFLLEITAKIFTKKDDQTDADLIDVILDAAGQKGTGKWTTDAAMNYGVAIPTITAAVDARIISASKEFRVEQSARNELAPIDHEEITVEDVRTAYELSVLNAYAQGLQLMSVASEEESWNLNIPEILRTWLGGCIIRSSMLEPYRLAFSGEKEDAMYLRHRFDPDFQKQWRTMVSYGSRSAIPLPAMSASLSYYDAYRTARLPQNVIQAQRDFFGAHTFKRTDADGSFHAEWE